jgi:NADPH2:quinone reductase
VLVHGAAGGVGSIAAQLAARGGANVIAVVRTERQQAIARGYGVASALLDNDPDLTELIRDAAPDGVHRIADVDLAGHIDLDAEIVAKQATISSYYSGLDRPEIPYWKLAVADTTLRLLGSDDFPPVVKSQAALELTEALLDRSLTIAVGEELSLDQIAAAHEHVEHHPPGRIVLRL